MAYYYINAFASAGDVTTVPVTGTELGSVNFLYGYGSNYSASLTTNPDALKIDRLTFNYLMNTMTGNWQNLYQNGIIPFISSAMNGGSPFSYSKNALVRYTDGLNYYSLVDTNTATPGTDATKWFVWNPSPSVSQVTVTSSPASSLVNTTVVANGGSLVAIPLPPVASTNDGDTFNIIGAGAGGWSLTQASAQKIYFGNLSTTTGAGGSLASTNAKDNNIPATALANNTANSLAGFDNSGVYADVAVGSGLSLSGGTLTATGGGGGGELVLLATATASTSSTLDFTSLISSSYSDYAFVIADLITSTSSTVGIYLSIDNGSTWTQTMYSQIETLTVGGSTAPTYAGAGPTSPVAITPSYTGRHFSGRANLTNPAATGGTGLFSSSLSGASGTCDNATVNTGSNGTNAIRFAPSAGNFTSGKIYMYGVKNT